MVINFFHQAKWELLGMDVVELNPTLDVNNQTAVLAARLLHQGMGYASKSESALKRTPVTIV